jgi:hypothetical protein
VLQLVDTADSDNAGMQSYPLIDLAGDWQKNELGLSKLGGSIIRALVKWFRNARTAIEQWSNKHLTLIIRKQHVSLYGMCPSPIWVLCQNFSAGVPDSGLTI